MVILSGWLLHCGYTTHIAKRLSEEGYTTVTYDLRGQGYSEGDKGQWKDYKGLIKDAYEFLKKIF